jgi:hypothetical protein
MIVSFEKPEAVLENEPPLVGGVDRNCSTNILSMLLTRIGLCRRASSRAVERVTTSCGGQLSSTGTAQQTRWRRALARCFMALRSTSLVAGDDCKSEKPEAAFENDQLWLAVSIATAQQHSVDLG